MIIDSIAPILQWLNTHPQLAGFATFIISATESIAIIGTIIPGSIMMTAIGALAGAGIIPLWATISWAILGAMVGDGISYWIGYYFKDRLHAIWPFRSYPNILASGKNFFAHHGAKSVFIGRFVGPVRALVPLIAGMLGVTPLRFTIANVTSAILWAPVYMLPGIILGAASIELPPEIATRLILALILTGLFIILCVWLLKKALGLIHQQIEQALITSWNQLEKSRYFRFLTALLTHYDKTKRHGQLTLGFYFIVVSIALYCMVQFVIHQGPTHLSWNIMTQYFFRSLRTPAMDNAMLLISFLGEKYVVLPLSITVFIVLAYFKRWHTAWHVLAAGLISGAMVGIAKTFTHIERPWGVAVSSASSDLSFPSGHTTLAIVFYFGIALLLIQLWDTSSYPKLFRKLLYSITSILVTLIIFSRLYFGVHWLTDILASILLGIAILILLTLSYNRHSEKNYSHIINNSVVMIILITLCVSYSLNLLAYFSVLKQDYQLLPWPIYHITLRDWENQQGEHFPLYRINRLGLITDVFNVQWIDDLETIQAFLLKNGWKTEPKHDWLRIIYRITGTNSTEHLPLVSPTYLDKPPVLVLLKSIGHNKLLILRFWQANILIDSSNNSNTRNKPASNKPASSKPASSKPVWLGTVELAPSTYSWLFKKRHPKDIQLEPSLLFKNPPSGYTILEKTITIQHNQHTVQQAVILIKDPY